MGTDKTLADVQPGGRVRLGDHDERARFEAFLRGNPLIALSAGTAWQVWQAALSAQPSPGGQDAAIKAMAESLLCAESSATLEDAREQAALLLADALPHLAARQPVGKHGESDEFLAGVCVALQCVTAQDCGVLWAEIVRAVGVDDLL